MKNCYAAVPVSSSETINTKIDAAAIEDEI
jgi:hypothetical protein